MHSELRPRRYHGLDAARGVLMALGVVLHAANVYAQDQTWLIGDTARHPFFDLLSDAIHVFRMPAFFLLSGFFAAMMLERHPPARFLARRFRRLAFPLIAAGVLLNGIQGFFLQSAQDGAQSLWPYLASFEYWNTWITGDWIGHLWFLIVLLLYTAVTIILYRPLRCACRRFAANPRHALWILLGFPVLSIAVHAVARPSTAVSDPFYGSISLHTLVTYLPYYLCGLALYHWRNFEPSALRAWPALLVATIIWAALRGAVFSWPEPLAPLHALLRLLLPWLLVCWILLLFARFADRPTPVSRFIADSSYTVYLFHHLAVILLASALLNVPWNPFAKFAVTMSAALLLTFAIILSLTDFHF